MEAEKEKRSAVFNPTLNSIVTMAIFGFPSPRIIALIPKADDLKDRPKDDQRSR